MANFSDYQNRVDVKAHWWKEPSDKLFASVFAVLAQIEQNQNYRSLRNLKFARAYANDNIPALTPGMYEQTSRINGDRVTLNVIASCIDTVSAQISSNTPRPLFLTNNGTFSEQRRAKKLTAYMDGVFDQAKVYEVGKRVFVDCCIFGTGFMKLYIHNDQIACERILPDEIVVDAAESMYAQPRQMHQRRLMSRDVVQAMFPDQPLVATATTGYKAETMMRSAADLVLVVESWHLPSGLKSGDGKHTICLDNCVLFEETYEKDYFPFAVMRWTDAIVGYYGSSLTEQIIGLQLEISKLLRLIQKSQEFASVPRVFLDNGSNVNSAHIDNGIGTIVKYTGQPPVIAVAQAQTPEIYQHLERLYAKAYQISGVSEMSAQASKPAGIEAGVALRTLRQMQSERFILTSQRYEQLYMDATDIICDLSQEISEDSTVNVKVNRKRARSLKWGDVKMDRETYKTQVFPTNKIPHEPAGRLQFITDLMKSGMMDPTMGQSLLDFPDLDGYLSLETAAIDDIKMCIEDLLDGKYSAPEPYQNLDVALKMVQSAYLRAKTEGAPEDVMELMRTFMSDIETLLGQNAQLKTQQAINLSQTPVTPSVSVAPGAPAQMEVPAGMTPSQPAPAAQ